MKGKLVEAWDTVAWFLSVAGLTALSAYGAMQLINNESETVSAVVGITLAVLLIGRVLIKTHTTKL